MPLVSIIIPIYNVAPYIEVSVRSALNQSYDNIEFIFVDDCGSDNSIDILLHILSLPIFSNKNTILLKHNSNRGLSAARNTGLLAANGQFVFFMDSDDSIPNDCIQKHVQAISKYDADLSDGAVNVLGGRNPFVNSSSISFANNNNLIQNLFFDKKLHVSAWNKLIRTDFLRDNNLFFAEGLIYEDAEWMLRVIKNVRSAVIIPDKTYNYLIRKKSITTTLSQKHINSRLHLNHMITHYIDVCDNEILEKKARHYFSSSLFRYTALLTGSSLNLKTKKDYFQQLNSAEFTKYGTGVYGLFLHLPFSLFYTFFAIPRKLYSFLIHTFKN